MPLSESQPAFNCLSQTTAHGLPHIANEPTKIERGLWVFFFLCAIGAFVGHSTTLVVKFFEEPISTSYRDDARKFQPPDVHICPNQIFSPAHLYHGTDGDNTKDGGANSSDPSNLSGSEEMRQFRTLVINRMKLAEITIKQIFGPRTPIYHTYTYFLGFMGIWPLGTTFGMLPSQTIIGLEYDGQFLDPASRLLPVPNFKFLNCLRFQPRDDELTSQTNAITFYLYTDLEHKETTEDDEEEEEEGEDDEIKNNQVVRTKTIESISTIQKPSVDVSPPHFSEAKFEEYSILNFALDVSPTIERIPGYTIYLTNRNEMPIKISTMATVSGNVHSFILAKTFYRKRQNRNVLPCHNNIDDKANDPGEKLAKIYDFFGLDTAFSHLIRKDGKDLFNFTSGLPKIFEGYNHRSICVVSVMQKLLFDMVNCTTFILPVDSELIKPGPPRNCFSLFDKISAHENNTIITKLWKLLESMEKWQEVYQDCEKKYRQCLATEYLVNSVSQAWPIRLEHVEALLDNQLSYAIRRENKRGNPVPGWTETYSNLKGLVDAAKLQAKSSGQSNGYANSTWFNSKWLKNIAKVTIFPQQVFSGQTEESLGYTSRNLMSDVSGIIGFYIGISFLTACELFHWIYHYCWTLFYYRKRKAQKNDQKTLDQKAGQKQIT